MTEAVNPIDRITQLKAARLTELANEKAAKISAEREQEEKRQAAWQEGVTAGLDQLDASWLSQYRKPDQDGDPFDSNRRTFRNAAFAIPGHHLLLLRVEDISFHDAPAWRVWPVEQSNWLTTWAVRSGTAVDGHRTLADALIAAEQETPAVCPDQVESPYLAPQLPPYPRPLLYDPNTGELSHRGDVVARLLDVDDFPCVGQHGADGGAIQMEIDATGQSLAHCFNTQPLLLDALAGMWEWQKHLSELLPDELRDKVIDALRKSTGSVP